jgi:hypothetical protein
LPVKNVIQVPKHKLFKLFPMFLSHQPIQRLDCVKQLGDFYLKLGPFNSLFTTIGQKISDVEKRPEDNINCDRPIPNLQLENTTPEHILKIVPKFKLKFSQDIYGISTKMVKIIGNEIAIPLAHIFNLSLGTGTLPEQLKQSRVIPIFKSGSRNGFV